MEPESKEALKIVIRDALKEAEEYRIRAQRRRVALFIRRYLKVVIRSIQRSSMLLLAIIFL
jgi:hypothetical protein